MKIVSYNINTCTQKKLDELFKMNADVFVVPEIAREDKIKLPDGFEMKWSGDEKLPSKGLGIIWKKGVVKVPEWYDKSLHYAIPVFVDGILILGIWPTKLDKKESYTQIAKDILDHYSEKIKENKTIVTGDFNLYHNDEKKNTDADLHPINELLKSLGMSSVYHKDKKIELGQEREATYYHQFKNEQPFFLDYTYSNIPVNHYELLEWNKDMSDHVGQVFEVDGNNENVEIIQLDSSDLFDDFYKEWDLVFVGVFLDEAYEYLDFLKLYTHVKNRVYTFKGKLMNDKYHLTGDNRYPDDLTFIVVRLEDIEDVGKIALPRFEIGGRWFNDIVDKNARQEEEKL